MKVFLLLLLATALIHGGAHTQSPDSLRYKYNNLTIYRYGKAFMKGNEKLRFRDLRNEFAASEMGEASYFKAKKYLTTSIIFSVAAIASTFATVAFISGNNRNTWVYFFGGQLTLSVISGKFRLLSNQSVDRAIWLRNKDILFPK